MHLYIVAKSYQWIQFQQHYTNQNKDTAVCLNYHSCIREHKYFVIQQISGQELWCGGGVSCEDHICIFG